MFCVIRVEKRADTLREKLFGRFIKDEYNAKMIPVFKGAPLYIFKIVIGRNEVDWDRVVYCAGKCASRLVLAKNVALPQRDDMTEFQSDLLYKKMMGNTFAEVLRMLNSKKSIAIIDPDGNGADFLYKVYPFASSLTVITNAKKKYEIVCDEIQEETGISTVLQSSTAESEIKIDLNRSVMTITNDKGCINISDGYDFSVPEIYEKLLPENVNKYNFYSALYELCGVFSLGDGVFEKIMVNNEKISLQEFHFS